MPIFEEVSPRPIIMGRLEHGKDLLEELTAVCRDRRVDLGRVEAIGAVSKAQIGYYDQEKKTYQFLTIEQPMEITGLLGNVSLKDGDPMVHAHVTLADSSGRVMGGHLAPGTIIFACEFIISPFDGPLFQRGLDKTTGLPLWNTD